MCKYSKILSKEVGTDYNILLSLSCPLVMLLVTKTTGVNNKTRQLVDYSCVAVIAAEGVKIGRLIK